MSSNSNAIKDAHLGMSHGKAAAILKKNIMFNLLERLNENYCFKCNWLILTPEDLSVEHKIPWLYGDISLFWDLDNIAFSHLRCNRPDRPYTNDSHNRYRYDRGCRCEVCTADHALKLREYRTQLKGKGIKRKN